MSGGLKWYVVESRNGADAFTCRASSREAAMRAARYFDPSAPYVKVREEAECERIEREAWNDAKEAARV